MLIKELPVSTARQLVGFLALGLLLVGRQCKLLADETGDRLDGLGDVGIRALDDMHRLVRGGGEGLLRLLFLSPQAEARQRRRDRRHAIAHTLQRRIAPGLVVAGVDGQVHTHEEVVVALVEDTVEPIEVAGHEDDLHTAVGAVEATMTDVADGTVMLGIVQPVAEHGVLQGALLLILRM